MSSDARRLDKARALLPHCIPACGGVWADIGCGDGVFTTVIQAILGPQGRVIAVDRDPRALQRLKDRFRRDHPTVPCETVIADFTSAVQLPMLDGIVLANTLHFVTAAQQQDVLRRLSMFLRAGGRAVVVEYNTRTPNPAVPHPLDAAAFPELADLVGLEGARIAARVPSSFLGEMYAGLAFKPGAERRASP